VGTLLRGIALFPRGFAVTCRRLAVGALAFTVADDDEVGTEPVAGFAAREPDGGGVAGHAARDPDGRVGVCIEDVAAAGFAARDGGGPMGSSAADEKGSLATPFTAAILCATPPGTLWFRETPGTTEPATPTRIVVAASLSAAAAISGGKERTPSSWETVMLCSILPRNIDTKSWEGFGFPARYAAAYSAAFFFAAARDTGVASQTAHKQVHLQMLHWHASKTAVVSVRLWSRLGAHTGQVAQFR